VVPQKKANWLIKVYKLRTNTGACAAPGRIGPAMAGFFVEPMPLDYWRLKKSLKLTRNSPPLPCPDSLMRCFGKFIGILRHSSEPDSRRAYCAIIALLVIPTQTLSETVPHFYNRSRAIRYVFPIDGEIVIVAVVFGERRRHSSLASPEIIGRVVFFILAVGRSPPASATSHASDLL
jgi:hypothetical protein